MRRPKRCHGTDAARAVHCRECRPGRPLCRYRRARPCCCGAYHYPHRPGSGRCGDAAALEAWTYGPPAHEPTRIEIMARMWRRAN